MSNLARSIRQPTTLWVCGLWLALMAAAPTLMMKDPGMFWHTVVGEQMLRSGSVVTTDTFSFTQEGESWLAQQWLGELAMGAAHRLGGLDSVITLAISIIALIFGLIFWKALRSGLPLVACLLLTILTIAASSYHFIPRPHLFTMLAMMPLMLVLARLDQRPTNSRWALILPPLFLIWTNIHGGALGGIASFTLYCLLWLLQPSIGLLRPTKPVSSAQRARTIKLLTVALGLVLVTPLINPFGVALPRTWVSLMGSDLLPKVIIEHAPLDFTASEGLMILTLAGTYFYILVGAWRVERRVHWLLPAVWFLLACSRVRHGPLFAVSAGVVIVDMWRFHPRLRARLTTPTVEDVSTSSSFGSSLFPLMALTCVALLLQTVGIKCPLIGAKRCNPQAPTWPVSALPDLQQLSYQSERPLRVFNEMRYAGYLIYALPEAAVYIDDRCELHRDVGLHRYLELYSHPERLPGELHRYQIDVALVSVGSPFANQLVNMSKWRTVFQDSTVAVFARENRPGYRTALVRDGTQTPGAGNPRDMSYNAYSVED